MVTEVEMNPGDVVFLGPWCPYGFGSRRWAVVNGEGFTVALVVLPTLVGGKFACFSTNGVSGSEHDTVEEAQRRAERDLVEWVGGGVRA